jgi:hypothetical protein
MDSQNLIKSQSQFLKGHELIKPPEIQRRALRPSPPRIVKALAALTQAGALASKIFSISLLSGAIFFSWVFLGLLASAAPLMAQQRPITTFSLAHLFEILAKQPPLMELDLTIYEQNFAALSALNDEPSGLPAFLETTGWSEDRLIYAATKVGLGLMMIFEPQNPRLKFSPQFAKPTASELELISSHLTPLIKAIESELPPN